MYLSEKNVYYVFLFLKVSQCKLKQKETILKLGNSLKGKSKFTKSKIAWGASTSTPYQGFTLNPLRAFWLGWIFSLSIILISPPIKICSENTELQSFSKSWSHDNLYNSEKLNHVYQVVAWIKIITNNSLSKIKIEIATIWQSFYSMF